ncbi:MAG TPA: hypothetical protein VGD67_19230 [Pseudonocardiaceae bacterium]
MEEARAELRRRLGDEVAPVLGALTDEQAAELRALYRAAVDERRTTMADAQERSLALVPALLRPAVRKVLGA